MGSRPPPVTWEPRPLSLWALWKETVLGRFCWTKPASDWSDWSTLTHFPVVPPQPLGSSCVKEDGCLSYFSIAWRDTMTKETDRKNELIGSYSSRGWIHGVSVAVMSLHDQKLLGKERVSFTHTCIDWFITESRGGTWRQELKAKIMEGCCLLVCSSWFAQPALL